MRKSAMDVVDEIRVAYADSWMSFEDARHIRKLSFKASRAFSTEPDSGLREALDIIGGYNEFNPETVYQALSGYHVEVTVARENSVCLYIRAKNNAEARNIRMLMANVGADEVDTQDDGTIRVWWD